MRVLVKKLEYEKRRNVYLIEQVFKIEMIKQYLICKDYNFKSNTYRDGLIVDDIKDAYELYNYYVQNGCFPSGDLDENTN